MKLNSICSIWTAMLVLLLLWQWNLDAQAIVPNDPQFRNQWHLRKTGVTNAWAITQGNTNVIVALIDTGVDYTHPDLTSNMWRNPGETGLDASGIDKSINGVDDDQNGYIDDVHGIDTWDKDGDPFEAGFRIPGVNTPQYHGSHNAGLIGAVGNNSLDTVGVNWSVQIMAIRGFPLSLPPDATASEIMTGERRYIMSIVAALDYVTMMKQRGINIVVICHSYFYGTSSVAAQEAANRAAQEGILHIAAAGNTSLNLDRTTIYLPGHDSDNLITVAATLENDTLASFSSRGKSTVHLAAPGVNIRTTLGTNIQGTSFAAPQVAGAAALLKAAVPSASDQDIKAALLGSVDQSPGLRNQVTTHGRLNTARALGRLTNSTSSTIVIAMHPSGSRTVSNAPVRVTFSRPMKRESVEAGFSIQPNFGGQFVWADTSDSFSFVPTMPWVQTNYTVKILGTAQDNRGTNLDGNYDGTSQSSPVDDFQWTFGFPATNDDFSHPVTLVGDSGSTNGTTMNALLELDEPRHANNILSATSVWYEWRAPKTGWYTFDTLQGTSVDTLMAIYKGNEYVNLAPLAANDDFSGNRSRASFNASKDETYKIAVAGKSQNDNPAWIDSSAHGNFQLSWYPTPPPQFSSTPFRPLQASPGARITLTGTNFTGTQAVLFNGAAGSITMATNLNLVDRQLVVTVPPDASSGPITIKTPHGDVTSQVAFVVLPPSLTISRTNLIHLQIRWPSTSSQFVLESTLDLTKPTWNPISSNYMRSTNETFYQTSTSDRQRFFRLRSN